MSLNEILGIAAVAAGVFFSAVGILGMMRLPDVYTRIHASGKVATLGLLGLLLGAALLMPEATLKFTALAVFMLVTAPVASHAIAAAAHRNAETRATLVRDDLQAAGQREE
jgi:multicomponent Na+:H+ antiporter subunit G